jgi:ATP-dependent helicase HrpA
MVRDYNCFMQVKQSRPELPPLIFPEALPVSGKRDEIAAAIAQNSVVIVCGETGSGKTTQLPKIAWMAGCGRNGLIGHTQPRRLAATSVAKRIAQEIGSPLGEHVGFKIRFNEQLSKSSTIKLMTDGVLLAETLSDPHLNNYDMLIVDEAHERSLNIDFLLGYLKQLLDGPRKGTLKLVITSATIDAQRFAEHFGSPEKPAPVIEVSGRLFPVEIRYQPLLTKRASLAKAQAIKQAPAPAPAARADEQENQDDEFEQSLPGAIADAVQELWRHGPGDVLVFLPGEREIRDCMEHLRRSNARTALAKNSSVLEILPLFSRLSAAEQDRVFSASNGFRIVLSTNVAETSLTVPGVRYVVDAGLARVKRYRYRSKVEQLQVESVSQAAANQRAGRCGRVANGICIRLYDEQEYLRREKFTDPEILRSSLAAVILRMKALKLPAVDDFPFIDRPPSRAILDGYALLTELQCIDDNRQLTPIGKQLSRLPLDPRIARMLLAAHELQCLPEVLILAAALSVQDPRERPMEAQQAADQKHLRFTDERSDFVGWLKLWTYWRAAAAEKDSNRALQERLKREYLSPRRFREWSDVYAQLTETVSELGWLDNTKGSAASLTRLQFPLEAPHYERLHRALLAGLLGNIGLKSTDSNVFLGAHEVKFHIHPGSALSKKPGKWVMAAELVETTKLYARQAAQIQVDWIEKAAGHLLRRSCADARWEKKAAQVMAFERGVLYGLPIYTQRRVHFGPMNPELSRELFIRGALVSMDWDARLPFLDHNKRVVAEIESLEHRIRRQDLLIDDAMIYAFFDARVPADIVSGAMLEKWLRSQKDRRSLFLSKEDLIRKSVDGIGSEKFPATMLHRGLALELQYHFEPGSTRDGVSLQVPVHLLNQIDLLRCEWLVPGMLKEKVIAYVKTLAPKQRHRLQPIDEFAQRFVEQCAGESDQSFLNALRDAVKQHTQLPVLPTDFRTENIASHCWMRFVVHDEHGRELGSGRDLGRLRAEFGQQAQSEFRMKLSSLVEGNKESALGSPSPKTLTNPTKNQVVNRAINQAVNPAVKQSVKQAGTRFTDWSFGPIEELLELRAHNGELLYGYPGLVSHVDGVSLEVFDDPDQAKRAHSVGLRLLFALQFKEQVKTFERQLVSFHEMTMQYMTLGSAQELRQQLLDLTIDRACMNAPVPTNREQFELRVNQARPKFVLLSQEVGRLVSQILTEYVTVQKKLVVAKAYPNAFKDLEQQLRGLIDKRFIATTPWEHLTHLPRYLKAMALRVDKLKVDQTRDQQRYQEMSGLLNNTHRLLGQRGNQDNARLLELRWLIEELRVSLFAQELKTPMPVSVKRLEKLWLAVQAG